MCGIYFTTRYSQETYNLVSNRGRDNLNIYSTGDYYILVSVLAVRTFDPQTIDECLPIAYNGEIYNNEPSDTVFIQGIIKNIMSKSQGMCDCRGTQVLSINGWQEDILKNNGKCFCSHRKIYQKIEEECELALLFIFDGSVYFFKDDIGRRSLGFTMNEYFSVSSVNFEVELDPGYFYRYDIIDKLLYRQRKHMLKYNIPFVMNTSSSYEHCFYNLMIESVKRRTHELDNVVFFSGGVDSLLIAAVLSDIIDQDLPIYLVNTQFGSGENCFDRINGLEAYNELKIVYPYRNFIFIENNVDCKLFTNDIQRVKSLIYPKTTIMDQNIGLCLFYTTKMASKLSKVAFIGSGADELFCGYNNHFVEEDLKERIARDVRNIWERNLGRDDRVISDNNMEPRFPFLDINLIRFVYTLPSEYFFTKYNGVVQNKSLIRNTLRRLGFVKASGAKKKAMQFGSGISKLNY